MDVFQLWLWYRRLPVWALIVPPLALMFLGVMWINHLNQDDRAEHDATFLRQCAEAGYDAAKCRFFLTATGRGNTDAALQMILQAAH